jgi:hypothetical protein
MVLVVATRISLIARPVKICPNKREMRKLFFSTEVFDVVSKCVQRTFTIGTATALQLFKLKPDFSLLVGLHVVPDLRGMLKVGETNWRGHGIPVEFVHVYVSPGPFRLSLKA